MGSTPRTVRRYVRGGIEAETQVRPSARALTLEQVRLVRRLYVGEAKRNAAEVTRRLSLLGIVVSARTVRRVVADKRAVERAPAIELGEGAALLWPGKAEARTITESVPRGRLVHEVDGRRSFRASGHALIVGDNLLSMRLLERHVQGRVKFAFVDPPYGSGERVVFDDTIGTTESLRTAAWLSMIYPRLVALRPLLASDGVVAMTINDARYAHARLVLDEVLGARSHVGSVVVQTIPGARLGRGGIAGVHEHLVLYVRDPQARGAIRLRDVEPPGQSRGDGNDERGAYRLYDLRALGDREVRGGTPRNGFPLYVDPKMRTVRTKRDHSHKIAVYPRGGDGRWTWSRPRVDRSGDLLVAKPGRDGLWRVLRKKHLGTADALPIRAKSLWTDPSYLAARGSRDLIEVLGARVFDFPKSVALLRRLVEMTTRTSADHVVLDVFAGSGSLGEAVLRMNKDDDGDRLYIGLQSDEPTRHGSIARAHGYTRVSDITAARLDSVARGLGRRSVPQWTISASTGRRSFSTRRQ